MEIISCFLLVLSLMYRGYDTVVGWLPVTQAQRWSCLPTSASYEKWYRAKSTRSTDRAFAPDMCNTPALCVSHTEKLFINLRWKSAPWANYRSLDIQLHSSHETGACFLGSITR